MTRSYPLYQVELLGEHLDWPHRSTAVVSTIGALTLQGTQLAIIDSDNKRVNGKYPPGGDWIAWRRMRRWRNSKAVETVRPFYGPAYRGKYTVDSPVPNGWEPTYVMYDQGRLNDLTSFLESLGAEGYAKARPAKPDFSLATSIAELKDIPGMLKQSIHACINRILVANPHLYYSFGRNAFFRVKDKSRLSHTAEWYLALNFGWLPILSDCINFMEATAKQDASLKQLLRDEGRPVVRRRKLELPPHYESESKHTVNGSNPNLAVGPIHVTQCYPGSISSATFVRKSTAKCEFVGKFRYWLPEGPRDFPWTRKIRKRMLGSRITPSVAWNLMPWTFLVDYFVTLDSAIANLGPGVEDQLIMDYGYVTFTEEITFTQTYYIETWGEGHTNGIECSVHDSSVLKMRISADPFAFRLKGGGPTLKQTAIIAALAAK